mmetsp:Transcript_25887/g.61548  ORF Transcript_25887/g.61548 Transcript_25887/m.61548 type:complete len:373 (+) Transcript_25887:363-1481(+)
MHDDFRHGRRQQRERDAAVASEHQQRGLPLACAGDGPREAEAREAHLRGERGLQLRRTGQARQRESRRGRPRVQEDRHERHGNVGRRQAGNRDDEELLQGLVQQGSGRGLGEGVHRRDGDAGQGRPPLSRDHLGRPVSRAPGVRRHRAGAHGRGHDGPREPVSDVPAKGAPRLRSHQEEQGTDVPRRAPPHGDTAEPVGSGVVPFSEEGQEEKARARAISEVEPRDRLRPEASERGAPCSAAPARPRRGLVYVRHVRQRYGLRLQRAPPLLHLPQGGRGQDRMPPQHAQDKASQDGLHPVTSREGGGRLRRGRREERRHTIHCPREGAASARGQGRPEGFPGSLLRAGTANHRHRACPPDETSRAHRGRERG